MKPRFEQNQGCLARSLMFMGALLIAAPMYAASTWFVDSTATGAGNGTSWTDAWTSPASVTGVSGGDTVNISGGPSGTSQTYNMGSFWNPPSGSSSANRVLYQIGQDSAHNGTAIFNATTAGVTWFSGPTNIIVSGDAGDGLKHLKLMGYAAMLSSANALNWRISYMGCPSIPTAGSLTSANGIEIDHCNWIITDLTADHCLFANFTGVTWDDNKFHDCTIQIPNNGNGLGADGLQFDGVGFSVYNNTITGYISSYTGGQHQDGLQSTGNSSYIKFYNNVVVNIANYAFFGDAFFGGFSNTVVYNNLISLSTSTVAASNSPGGIVIGVDGGYAGSTPCTFSNVVVANNIVVDYIAHVSVALNNITSFSSTFTGCVVSNNISLNSGAIDLTNNTTTAHSGNVPITLAQGASSFKSYAEFGGAANDLHPALTDLLVVDKGVDLSAVSSFLLTDKDGTSRPQGPSWDSGPYEQVPGAPVIITQPTPTQTVAAGSTVTLTAAARGVMPLVYQWQKNGVNLSDVGIVTGSSTSTLTLTRRWSG